MIADWGEYLLGDLGEIKTGKTPPAKIVDAYSGEVPFITPRDMHGRKWIDSTERYLSDSGLGSVKNSIVPARSVAVSCIGSDMGKTVMVAKTSVTNQQINTIIVDETKYNAEFVYYNLSARQEELKGIASGSATPILNKGHFSNVKIFLPSKNDQDSIVDILRSIDDKIELNRQINIILEEMAQAIFKSWFLDFDPVKAKIEAKANEYDPERSAMCIISGKTNVELDQLPPDQLVQLRAIAALFPDELTDSELGLIPKRWFIQPLGRICSFLAGSAFAKKFQGQKSGDFPFIKVRDMNTQGNERFILSADNYITESQRSIMKAKIHPQGATVFAKIGVALMSNRRRILTRSTLIDNNMMSAVPKDTTIPFHFLYLLLLTIDFKTIASGTAVPYINMSDLNKISIPFPEKNYLEEIMRSFNKIITPIFEAIKNNDSQIYVLAELRDTLLPKLLSGEIEIGSATTPS